MLNIIFCSYWVNTTQWLQNHLLTCPFKKLTGIDCPGCGFQRSFIALLQGNLNQSLHYYPATIPLLVALTFTISNKWVRVDNNKQYVQKILFGFAGLVVISSYILKLSGHQFTPQF